MSQPGHVLADPGAPVVPFALVAATGCAILAAVLAGPLAGALWPAAAATYAAVVAAAGLGLIRHYPHRRLGLCNAITLIRAALIAGVAGVVPVAQALPAGLAWATVAVATLALALDGADGWAARRAGLTSGYGARFDMEVDSVFALVLALIVVLAGKVGPWAILLGTARYLFVAAMWVWPWLNRPTPPRFSGKVVCVVQIAVLIALVAPPVAGWPATALALAALAGVGWSFGRDILWLWRRR